MTLVETGTRALLGGVFGPTAEGETSHASRLMHLLRPDMLVLWDKGFDGDGFLASVTARPAPSSWAGSAAIGVHPFSHVSPTAHTCR